MSSEMNAHNHKRGRWVELGPYLEVLIDAVVPQFRRDFPAVEVFRKPGDKPSHLRVRVLVPYRRKATEFGH